jgi:hypothetical protein
MTQTLVYHEQGGSFGFGPQKPFPGEEGDFLLAARVDTDDPDEAFRLTQHIDEPWYDNPECHEEPHPETGQRHRSTSAGDVVVTPDGKHWRCEPVGWTEFQP